MQIVKLNLIPGGVLPVCFASQHDTGRVIRFMLFEGENVFTLSGAETIALRLQKPDGSELVESVTNTGADYVDVVTTADTCDTAGASVGEIVITDGGDVLGSGNFGLFVESDAFDGGGIVTQTASGPIATFETNIETAFVSLKSDINPVQDLHGYSKPWSGGGGKNKFNDTTGTHTINANTDTTITIGDVYLEANTTYTISCKQTPAPLTSFVRNTLSVVGNGTTTYNPAGNDYTIKPMVFTPTVSGTYSIRVWGHTLSANTTYSQFQVEVGSTATAYEPYSNICPISGFNALSVTRTGVNLFDGTKVTTTTPSNWDVSFDSDTSTLTIEHKNTYTRGMPVFNIPSFVGDMVISGTFGANIDLYVNGAWSRSLVSGTSFSCTSGNVYSLAFQNPSQSTLTYKVQLELGDKAHAFTPYNGQTATVNFGQTVYGGSLDVTNGKVNVTHGLITLNGSETWIQSSNSAYINNTDAKIVNEYGNGISDQYEFGIWGDVTGAGSYGKFTIYKNTAWTAARIAFALGTQSAADFKASLANSPVTLVYELATPIEITTTPENLTAIVGQNNVFADTNGDTEVEYYIEV